MSVYLHSQPNPGYVLFAVAQRNQCHEGPAAYLAEQEKDYHREKEVEAFMVEQEIGFKKGEGKYDNIIEACYIVSKSDFENRGLMEFAKGQDCILKLDIHKHGLYKATMAYLQHGTEEMIGYMRGAPSAVAAECIAYTKFEDGYYIVTKEDDTTWDKLRVIYNNILGVDHY